MRIVYTILKYTEEVLNDVEERKIIILKNDCNFTLKTVIFKKYSFKFNF